MNTLTHLDFLTTMRIEAVFVYSDGAWWFERISGLIGWLQTIKRNLIQVWYMNIVFPNEKIARFSVTEQAQYNDQNSRKINWIF